MRRLATLLGVAAAASLLPLLAHTGTPRSGAPAPAATPPAPSAAVVAGAPALAPAAAAPAAVPAPAVAPSAPAPTASPAGVAPAAQPAPSAAPAPAPLPPAAAGMVIALDPETGELGMPSAAQLSRLLDEDALRLNHSDEGLVQEWLPDGSVMLDLRGRFQEHTVVHLGPGGRPTFQCVSDPAALHRALASPPPVPSRPEER